MQPPDRSELRAMLGSGLCGLLGAAAVNMAARIVAQLAIAWWNRRHIGIDTSLWGVMPIKGPRPATPL